MATILLLARLSAASLRILEGEQTERAELCNMLDKLEPEMSLVTNLELRWAS